MKVSELKLLGFVALLLMVSGSLAGSTINLGAKQVRVASLDNDLVAEALHHDTRDGFYRNPGWGTQMSGAVAVGTDVTIRFRTAGNDATSVQIKLWNNVARQDNYYEMSKTSSDTQYDYWEYTVGSPSIPTDYYYAFVITDGSSTKWYGDDYVRSIFEDTRTYQTGGIGRSYDFHDSSGDYALVFYDAAFQTPDWHKQAVGYQIFIDRFFNGDNSNDPIGDGTGFGSDTIWNPWDSDDSGNINLPREGGIYVNKSDWNSAPQIFNYYGGDFQGIIEKIDHLSSLGIDFIWFNPFSESTDNHGYSVVDYRALDSYYGVLPGRTAYTVPDGGEVFRPQNNVTTSMEFFNYFDQILEDNGIKIIYDTVINHASAESKYFQRFEGDGVNSQIRASGFDIPDFYPGTLGAFENFVLSPYAEFFDFTSAGGNADYNSWFGFDTIPTVIYDTNGVDTGALNEFVTGPNNIFDFWLDNGVDGFRLDVNDIYVDGDNSNTVNKAIRDTVKANDPDAVIIGEIWSRATQQLKGDQNDATQNMLFRFNILDWMRGNYDDDLIVELLRNTQDMYPRQSFESLWVNLGNHDRTRVLSVLDGSYDRLKVASTIQFAYPGVPVVWYGDEIGTEGFGDPGTRQTFKWDKIEGSNTDANSLNLLHHYQNIIHIKKNYEVMQSGDFHMLEDNSEGVISLYRQLEGDTNADALIIANRDEQAKRVTIDLSDTGLSDGQVLANVLDDNRTLTITGNELTIDIPAYGHVIFMGGITDVDDNPFQSSGTTTTTTSDTTTVQTDDESSDKGIGNPLWLTLSGSFIIMVFIVKKRRTKY